MPKIEYGKDVKHIEDLKKELENLKVERMNAFIDNDTSKVEYYTKCMDDIKTELESLNVVEY